MPTKLKDINDKVNYYFAVYGQAINLGSQYRQFGYGGQWDANMKQRLKNNNLPAMIQNEIGKYQRALIGEFAANTPQIQVVCHDSTVPAELIEAYQASIQKISNRSYSNRVYTSAFDDATTTGLGAAIYLYIDYENSDDFKKDIFLEYVDYTSMIFDPDAVDITRCDGSFCGYFKGLSKDKFKKEYPGEKPSESSIYSPFSNYNKFGAGGASGQYDDQVILCHFFQKEYFKKTIYFTSEERIIEDPSMLVDQETIFEEREVNDFKIQGYVCSEKEILSKVEFPVKYLPMVHMSGYQRQIYGQIQPYSYGYDVHDMQRLKNITLSQLSSMILNMRKETHIWEKETVDSHTLAMLSNPLKQQGAFLYDSKGGKKPPPQVIPPPQLPTTLLEVYGGIDKEIDGTLGRTASSRGEAGPANSSGVAESIKVNQSNLGSYFYVKNAIAAINQVGTILKALIPKLYVEERSIATRDRIYNINTKEEKDELIFYNIDPLKYEIDIKAGPSFEIQRQEHLAFMKDLLTQLPPEYKAVLLPQVLELMDLPNITTINNNLMKLVELRSPDLYAVMKGEDVTQIQQEMAQRPHPPSPEQQAEQMKMQIAQGDQQLKKRAQDLDMAKFQQDQKLKEMQAFANYQIENEKIDIQEETTDQKLEATRIKSEAEIGKAIMDMVKSMKT